MALVAATAFALFVVRGVAYRVAANAAANAHYAAPCDAYPVTSGLQYFAEVHELFSTSQDIILTGFIFHPDLPLFKSGAGGIPDTTLLDLIKSAADRGAQVWILGWDNIVAGKVTPYNVSGWFDHIHRSIPVENRSNIHLLLDTGRTKGSIFWSAHIKSAVFDRRIAYVGGMDFAENRLDGPQHWAPDSRRIFLPESPSHNEKPWQDVMVKVEGQVAMDVAMIAVERWYTYCDSLGYKLHRVSRIGRTHAYEKSQCKHKPAPGRLGTLTLSGYDSRPEMDVVADAVRIPEIQSKGLDQEGTLSSKYSLAHPGQAAVEVFGLRALDTQVPDTLEIIEGGKSHLVSPSGTWITLNGRSLMAAWHPNVPKDELDQPVQHRDKCAVVLSGCYHWLGTKSVLRENYEEYVRIIETASRYVYIENQYFTGDFPLVGECEASKDLYSGSVNTVPQVLLNRILQASRNRESFSAALVLPLATEPGSFYPNLRSQYCFHETLEHYWKTDPTLHGHWSDYFSMFFLANVGIVTAGEHIGDPAFYGIFVHSKVMIADDKYAIVGSANVNDRSMSPPKEHGSPVDYARDGEVGVLIEESGGGFPRRLLNELLDAHVGDSSRVDTERFVPSLRRVALDNADRLRESTGIDIPAGTYTDHRGKTKKMFDLRGYDEQTRWEDLKRWVRDGAWLNTEESFIVAGGGAHQTFDWLVAEGRPKPDLTGLLFLWSPELWGYPKMTHRVHSVRLVAWAQVGDNDDMDPATMPAAVGESVLSSLPVSSGNNKTDAMQVDRLPRKLAEAVA